MLKLLTFSTLYPNDMQPNHGIFVENRLRHLVASGEVTSTGRGPGALVSEPIAALRRLGKICVCGPT